jgi:pimeloyl-ACP methyl ester carboxylesterase
MGLSDKPAGGYHTGTQARDLIGLMDALVHGRFAVVGHDTGFAISYARSGRVGNARTTRAVTCG